MRFIKAALAAFLWLAGLTVQPVTRAQVSGQYLPPGPADPTRPNWSGAHRDLPWWFQDAAGPSDAYDTSLVWAVRYNSGGASGYEAGIVSPPGPLGNQGVQSDNPDRTWVSGTSYPFTVSYTWTGSDISGTGAASITIGGSTSTAPTAFVNDRVAAFVNGTAPALGGVGPGGSYAEPHSQQDLLLRLATVIPGGAGQSMSMTVTDLAIAINGGAPQAMVYESGGTQTSLTVTGAAGDTVRSVGFLLFDNLLTDYRDDFVLTGTLIPLVAGSSLPNTSQSRLLFEVKLGDYDLYPEPAVPIPEPSTWGAALLVLAAATGLRIGRSR